MKKNIKKILKVLGIFLLIILVALIAYLIYLFASYHRIPDNQALKIEKTSDGTAAADTLTTEKEYSALTYNVGFGAYISHRETTCSTPRNEVFLTEKRIN